MRNSTSFWLMPQMHMENRIPKLERFTFWILIEFFGYSIKIIFVTYVKMMPERGGYFYFVIIVMATKVTVLMPRW